MVKKLQLVLTLGDLLYSLKRVESHYKSDFEEVNKALEGYLGDLDIRKEKGLDINLQEVEKCVKEFWKKLILKFVDNLFNIIKNRTTKGGEFAEIKLDLEKTQKNLPYDFPSIKTLELYYENDLKDYLEIIKEKIQNEKVNEELNENNLKEINEIIKKSRNKGRIEGFIISLVTGLITGCALYKLGYM